MGMLITLSNVIIAIAASWVVTKGPYFGGLIALHQYTKLDVLFKRSYITSIVVASLGATLGWVTLIFLEILGSPLSERVLPPMPSAMILLSGVLVTAITGLSVYLRAHKKEPLVWVYFISTLIIGILTILLGRQWGAMGIATGYLLILLTFQLPISVATFKHSRQVWHQMLS
jgi:hypothetical protein